METLAAELLANFNKKVDIKKVIKAAKNTEYGYHEKIIGDVSYIYGSRSLTAYTDKLTFTWDVNSYGDKDFYVLFDIEDENGKSV